MWGVNHGRGGKLANSNRVYNRFDNLVPKLITSLLIIYLGFLPAISFAALDKYDRWMIQSLEENVDSTGRTTSARLNAIKRTTVQGSAREIQSIIDYAPKKPMVANVMKKRLTQAAVGGGVGLIGVAAVDALLKGIGWIMEDGVYVKMKDPEGSGDDLNCQKIFSLDLRNETIKACQPSDAASRLCEGLKRNGSSDLTGSVSSYELVGDRVSVKCATTSGGTSNKSISRSINRDYDPNKVDEKTKIPITDSELADIMFGDYQGDPSANIAPHNNGDWTGVKETTTADPNAGEGTKDNPENEVTKDIDRELENNPNKKTKDIGTESNSKGKEETTKEDGSKEQTETESTTKLPAFCNYAAFLCKWIEWTQEDTTDDEEEIEIEKEEIDIPNSFDQNKVNFGSQCPSPLSSSYSLLGRSHSVSYSFDSVCDVAVKLKPAVVGCAGIAAVYIVLGINRKGDES